MSLNLFPNDYINSVYDIDFGALYSQGYRAVLFDVDNTLVEHNAPANDRAVRFFEELNAIGFVACLVSNNKEPRVKEFCQAVKYCKYVFKAGKPLPRGYNEAMALLGTNVDNTLFVGDQILTDVWGARRSGVRTIMVRPVKKWKEEIQIILKRFLEFFVLLVYSIYRAVGGKIIIKTPLK